MLISSSVSRAAKLTPIWPQNYEYWLPVPSLINPQIQSLITTYQSRAEAANADPLGYYVAPLAYSQLQVLEQAIREVGGTDDAALADYTRKATCDTVVGNVTFGEGGGWARPRVLTVQFQNIESNNISEFKKPNTQAVVYPSETASGSGASGESSDKSSWQAKKRRNGRRCRVTWSRMVPRSIG